MLKARTWMSMKEPNQLTRGYELRWPRTRTSPQGREEPTLVAPGGSQSWMPDSYSRHLKLIGNRPVRTRMQGGVGAGGGNTPGYPI